MRRKAMTVLIPLVLLTFFNYGCSAAALREKAAEMTRAALDEAKGYMAAQGKEFLEAAKGFAIAQGKELLTAAAEKAAAIAEEKIKEEREKQYVVLDKQLAMLPITGKDELGNEMKILKTWKDFDTSDPKGELDSGELTSLMTYISKETALRVARGELSASDAGKIAKDSGGAAAMLLLLYGAGKLAKKVGGKKNGNGQPVTTPPAAPPVGEIASGPPIREGSG